jgi:hypothetical protein
MIEANFGSMLSNYHRYNALPQPLQKFLNDLGPGNTPCCIQLSHSLNAANVTIPQKPSRRSGGNPKIPGGNGFYLLAVDEVEDFLSSRSSPTKTFDGKRVPRSEIKIAILGRQGILVFRSGGLGTYGFHTELWTGSQIVQHGGISGGMNEQSIFSQPRVLFWEVAADSTLRLLPTWLRGWWEVYDGNYYYYWFSDAVGAFYTKKKPSNYLMPPTSAIPEGYATVEVKQVGPVLTWNSGTVETFTRRGHDPITETEMNGTSNRYSPLFASKMG